MFRKVNRTDAIVCVSLFIAMLTVQLIIFFEHSIEWYKGFYGILSIIKFISLICAVCYVVFGFIKKKFINACIVLQCIGVFFAILQYQAILRRIDPSGGTIGLNTFMVVPYIVGIALAGCVLAIARKATTRRV